MQPGAELSFSYAEDGAVRRVTEVHELALPDSGDISSQTEAPEADSIQPETSEEVSPADGEAELHQGESVTETFPADEAADSEAGQPDEQPADGQ